MARSVWTQLDWVRRELGGAFPTDSLLLASFRLHAVGHLPTPADEMPPGVFLAIMHYSSKAQGAVAMFGWLVVFLAVACLRWRHQARSVVKHLNERFIIGKCLLGKSKVQGQRRAFEWRVPREITFALSSPISLPTFCHFRQYGSQNPCRMASSCALSGVSSNSSASESCTTTFAASSQRLARSCA